MFDEYLGNIWQHLTQFAQCIIEQMVKSCEYFEFGVLTYSVPKECPDFNYRKMQNQTVSHSKFLIAYRAHGRGIETCLRSCGGSFVFLESDILEKPVRETYIPVYRSLVGIRNTGTPVRKILV